MSDLLLMPIEIETSKDESFEAEGYINVNTMCYMYTVKPPNHEPLGIVFFPNGNYFKISMTQFREIVDLGNVPKTKVPTAFFEGWPEIGDDGVPLDKS